MKKNEFLKINGGLGYTHTKKDPILFDEYGQYILYYKLYNWKGEELTDFIKYEELPEEQRKAMFVWEVKLINESNIRQEQDSRDSVLYSGYGKKRTKLKSDAYYKEWIKNNNIEDAYYDQSFNYGIGVCSAYTSYGIKLIDSWLSKQIRLFGNEECEFTYNQLYNMILRNMNLHEVIKWNLIMNLKNYKKQNESNNSN